MPYYRCLGKVPRKRHTIFRKPDGSLYAEELISTEGFSSIYSLVYHIYPPTRVKAIKEETINLAPEIVIRNNMRHRGFHGKAIQTEKNYLFSRKILLANEDVQISLAIPAYFPKEVFFKNASADELIFVHKGRGVLKTGFGPIQFYEGDYLHIPRGTVYQIDFENEDNRLLIIESFSPIRFPKRYCNEAGQLMEHAPFYERDIRGPEALETYDEEGEFTIYIKKNHELFTYIYANHPFDFIGWDGYLYPYAFNIKDFNPIVGKLHQPPPVHQTFEGRGFVVCSFVPRLYDFDPEAIPAPYNHSNVDSDEVLYYVEGQFMSRKGIEEGFITLHPIGIPHGPHPGTVEKSIGQKGTEELAVMIDTFRPLGITKDALEIEKKDYYLSWL